MRAKKVFEVFTEDSDPIEDLGIGFLVKIKIAIQNIINKYNLKVSIKKIKDKDYYGYGFMYKQGKTIGFYSIIINNDQIAATYEGGGEIITDDSVECETIDEAKGYIEDWIEYALSEW